MATEEERDRLAEQLAERGAGPERVAWALKALDWVSEKWGEDHPCPYCQSTYWGISEDLVELRPFAGPGDRIPMGTYPVFQVICQNCGNTVLVNAISAGIHPKRQP